MGSTARCIPTPPTRSDLAWRHATESDLERISYTIDLSRWREPRDLSKRGARVLRFFAALHRCGRVGYVGTRASYAAIGAAIARATHEAASRSTVFRACDELREKGYLDRSRGRGARSRQVGPHEWIREPLAVLTLTDQARALWGAAPRSSHPSPPVSDCNGYALPEEPSIEGIPARDVVDASPSTSAAASVSTEEPASAGVELRGVAARIEPRQSARPVAPLAQLAGENLDELDEHAACQVGRSRFPSGPRPASRRLAVSALLATLGSLTRFSGREGAALVVRAKAEIAGRSDGPPTGIAWDYWIAKWPELAREERFRWARSEILPALRSTRASTSPPRIAAASPPASPPPLERPTARPSPPPRPPASPPGPPASIAEVEPDASNPYGAALARQLARLNANAETRAVKGPEK
jgi:DNA-binding MarR family transcriptional regulator